MTTEPVFSIRQADIDDIPTIRAMANIVFRKTYADILSPVQMEYMMDWMYSEESLRDQIVTPGKEFHIALYGDRPAGYVSFESDGRTDDGHRNRYHLQKLYILPDFQHHGLGRQMFGFVKNLLNERNPEGFRIELNVNRGNPAVGFYERLGMVRDRQGDFPIGHGFYMNDYIYIFENRLTKKKGTQSSASPFSL